MSTPVRTALIGYGYAGHTFHAPLISACPGLSLQHIVSSQAQRVQQHYPQATVSADITPVLADPAIELVVIASPNDSHFPLAQAALAAGKHVVVDKPFTLHVSEARQLLADAEAGRRLLSVFHNRRWDADFLTLQAMLADGVLGDITLFESRFERYRPQVLPRWREAPEQGGGLWYDLGPHLLDQVLQLFGTPLAIHAQLDCQRNGARSCDYFHVQLRYRQRQVRLSASCLVSGGSPRFAVHGTLGSYVKYGLDQQETALRRGEQPGAPGWGQDEQHGLHYWQHDGVEYRQPVNTLHGDYRAYYQGIAAAIRGTAANPVPPQQALAVMELIELGLASAAAGRELALA